MNEINIKFPDGNIKKFENGVSGYEIAVNISKSLAKESVAIELDGILSDLCIPITEDSTIKIIKRNHDEALDLIRHDCAHVMAEAVQDLFPGTQVTIGPAIKNGFYYDFSRKESFTLDDLVVIEKKMHEIINLDKKFIREVWDRHSAIDFFKKKGEIYKSDIIKDLSVEEEITIYKQGKWLDLCKGPHLPSTGFVGKSFKLMKVAGAYWRGDERN